MIVAIDPDVFVAAAKSDHKSKISLVGLSQRCSEMRFAVDGDEIEREYLRLLIEYERRVKKTKYDDGSMQAILELLQIILNDTDEYREPIRNQREEWLENLIAHHGCTAKVEPELLGICQNAQGMGLVILLVGSNASRLRLRNRGLRDAGIRWQFLSSMSWLDVRFTDDTDVVPSPMKGIPEKGLQDRFFELQSGPCLQAQDSLLRCIPTPPGTGEQIDVYARKEYLDARQPIMEVLVGECKLRKEGNEENRPIESDEITQTLRKMYAAARYERKRLSRLQQTPVFRVSYQ